ncbi:MAG: DUF6472 family protein [Anaerotignum faecicola]
MTRNLRRYFCEVNLDEDEMEKFLTDSFQGGCPYYRLEDEYRTVRKRDVVKKGSKQSKLFDPFSV